MLISLKNFASKKKEKELTVNHRGCQYVQHGQRRTREEDRYIHRSPHQENVVEGDHPYKRLTGNLRPQIARTPQETFIKSELDKIIGLGDDDEVITLFTANIKFVDLSWGFVKPKVTNYDRVTDPKTFLSTFKYTLATIGYNYAQMCMLFQ